MEELNKILHKVLKIDINELNDTFSMKDYEIWDSLKHMELINFQLYLRLLTSIK